MKILKQAFAIFVLALFAAVAVNAQTSSTVTLQLAINESLTLTCSPSTVTFTSLQAAGTVAGNVPVSCLTTYSLGGAHTRLGLFVYAASAAALTSGASNISNTAVSASLNGGSYQPCSATDNFSSFGCDGGGSILASTTSGVWPAGSQTDSISFEIALAGTEAVGTYSGAITIAVMAL
jgi:hypothetical protein